MHYFCKRPVCTSSFEKSDTKADCFSPNLSLRDNVTGQQPLSDQNNNILAKKKFKEDFKRLYCQKLKFATKFMHFCEAGIRYL